MIPKTLSEDEDPLDIIILGPAIARGALVPVKLLGVLKFLNGGESDDKLLAVRQGDPLGEAEDIGDLEGGKFVNAAKIIELWFESYKGPGVMVPQGIADRAEANRIFRKAISAYHAGQQD